MALSNRQYDRLMREYSERRHDNEAELREKKDKLYLKIPELKTVDEEIARAAVEEARRAITSEEDPSSDYFHASGERLKAISKKREKLLKSHNIPADYLTVKYNCPDCRDTGFIEGEPCHCFVRRAAEISFENSKLPMNFQRSGFDDFSLEYYSPKSELDDGGKTPYDSAMTALKTAKSFTDNFSTKGGNLLFYGPPGVGKTMLSNCIANELLDKNFFVLYLSAFSLFETLKEGTFAKAGEVPDSYRLLFTCDLLIIDDLGTEFSNSLTSAQFFTLINERILNAKSTIVSTNLPLSGITETYTERLFSRFVEHYSFIHLFGKDIRLIKKLQTV